MEFPPSEPPQQKVKGGSSGWESFLIAARVEIISAKQIIIMTFFEEIDAWLTEVLLDVRSGESEQDWLTRVKPLIKDKILDSYRNGQKAGPTPRPAFRARQPETGFRGKPRRQ